MAFPRSPRTSSAFQSTRSRVLDTTYFFAASIVRAKGSIQSGRAPVATLTKNLSAELSALSKQQANALADAVFVGMTAVEALEYDNRHARILEILRGDGQAGLTF